MYMALIRREVEFSRNIKMLKSQHIKNNTAEAEMNVKSESVRMRMRNSLFPHTLISHISGFRYMTYYLFRCYSIESDKNWT